MKEGQNFDFTAQQQNGLEQDDFLSNIDLDKVISVLKKSIPWIIIIISFTCSSAYLYVRYTKPLYQSQSVIKLDLQSEASIIGISNPLENQNISGLSGEIELLKSNLFFDRVVNTINYGVSYYFYGQILVEERYRTSPFIVSHKVKNPSYFDRKIDLEIVDESSFTLDFGDEIIGTFQFGEEIVTNDLNLLIEKTPSFSNSNGEGKYYFTINSTPALIRYFQNNVKVEPLNFNAKTIRISISDHNKYKAQAFVQAIDTLYLAYTKEAKNKAIEQKISFLNTQLEQTNQRLEEFEDYFEDFTITNRTTSLENDLGEAIANLEILDTQYVSLKTALTNFELVSDQIDSDQPLVIGAFTTSAMPSVLGTALKEYNDLKTERQRKLTSYNENTFVIQQMDQQLESSKGNLVQLFEEYEKVLRGQIVAVDNRRKALENSFVQLPSMGTEFRKNRRFYNLYDETYLQLVRSKSELEIARAGTVTNFVILSPASNPSTPISPKKLLIYGIGAISGLLLSVVFVLVRYLLHNKINSVKELERAIKAPVLGSIPYQNGTQSSETRLVITEHSRSGLSEALRAIRTNMEFLIPNEEHKILSVTSTVSGEGKTFVSINLGAILSLSKKKVVVVDLDMRKPKVHLAFGEDKENGGVSTVLIGKEKLSDAIKQSKVENLYFLPAGPIPPNPSELLLGQPFEDFLDELKSQFDIIILDTPPVGLVTDGVLAMRKSDLTIYIFRSDYSKKSFVTSLNNLVRMGQFSNLSAVLNSVKSTRGYGYGYGYGYGEGYFEESKSKMNGSLFGRKNLAEKS